MNIAIAMDSSGPSRTGITAVSASARRATIDDAASIADLVNRAYRAEVFFVDGNRTSTSEVESMFDDGEFLVIDGPRGIVGAIFVDVEGADGDGHRSSKIAMVSVSPEFQCLGLGRRLVAIAEALSSAVGCETATLDVVSAREDLLRWYKGLGYSETGVAPYLHRPTKIPCHFVLFEKSLPLRDN
jgi:ribosomal protein S18 acetylase RimI-like enzyme